MKYKNILFDMDGTIIYSAPGVWRCILLALHEVGGKEPSLDVLKTCIGPPLTESFEVRLGLSFEQSKEAMKVFRKEYDSKGMFECELFDGILECICELKTLGYHIYLASSKNESACRAILEHFHLDEYFDDIIGSTDDAKIETKTQVLEELFRLYPNLNRSESILVGDTYFDALGAKEAGIDCLGVSFGFGTKESLLEYGAVGVVDSAREVKEYFETI